MYIKQLTALVAFGLAATVSAQDCDDADATFTVKSSGDAAIRCQTLKGSIEFEAGEGVSGAVVISGPKSIGGNLIIKNTSQIISLSSSTIANIGGKFELNGVERLSGLSFGALTTVGEISWIALPQLDTVSFGTEGVTKVNNIRISNTFLSSLDGLNLVSVDSFQIDNNRRLTKWETKLTNITKKLTIADNSADLAVSFPSLLWADEFDIRGIKSLSVPALRTVNGSMAFANNTNMESFVAANLTQVGKSLSFRGNRALSNVTLANLQRIGGGLTVQNNDKLGKIDGFPKLERVSGAVNIRGGMEEVKLPKLEDVKGTFDAISSADITSSCDELKKLAPKNQGGNGVIQGKFTCTPKSDDPNSGGSKPGDGEDEKDGAALIGINMSAVLGLALVAGVAQLL